MEHGDASGEDRETGLFDVELVELRGHREQRT
jgi:hypothetical protein